MMEMLDSAAASWWSWIAAVTVQAAVLGALVWAVDLPLKRRGWPQVRYALWALVFVKLLLPPTLALSTSIAGHILAPAQVPIASVGQPVQAIDEPTLSPDYVNHSRRAGMAGHTGAMGSAAPASTAPALRWAVAYPSVYAWTLLAWLAGMAVIAGCLVRRLRILRHMATSGADAEWAAEALRGAAARMGLRRLPRVVATPDMKSAAVFGLFRPTVFIPESWREEYSPKEISHILLHELAHIRRYDLAANALQTVLHIVFWFHPFVWLAGRRTRELRELCCDATVARILQRETAEYRKTLVEAGRRILAMQSPFSLGLLGLFESPARLRVRLEHLARPLWKHRRLRMVTALAAVAAMMLFVIPMARLKAAPAETAPATAPAAVPAATASVTPAAAPAPEVNAPAATPAPGTSIRGKLTTDDSAISLEGITVTAWAPDANGGSWHKAKAARDGSFSIDALEPGRYQVDLGEDKESRLVAKASRDTTVAAGEIATTSLVVMKGALVRGRLIDKVTRLPLVGGKGVYDATSADGVRQLRGTAGNDGSYEVVLAPGGWGLVGAYTDAKGKSLPDWDSKRDVVVKSGENMTVPDIEVNTSPTPPANAGRIAGKVTAAEATLDVSGYSIIAIPSTHKQADVRTAVTAEDGSFTMDGLTPGEYQVDLRYDLKRPAIEERISHATVVADTTTELTIPAVRGALVSGRAVDAVTHAPLDVSYGVSLTYVEIVDGRRTTSHGGKLQEGATYKYRLAPATYGVSAYMQDATGNIVILETSNPTVTLKPGEEITMPDILVTMPKASAAVGKIVGKVTAADSTLDVSGLSVFAMPRTYKLGDCRTAVTGKDGSFTLTAVTPGRYQVDLKEAPGRPAVEEEVNQVNVTADKTTELTITAVRGALVSGRAVDAGTRKPLDASDGVALTFVRNADGGGTTSYGGNLLEGGTYKYRLAPATYWVEAYVVDAKGTPITLVTSKPTVALKPGEEITMPDVLVTMPQK